jgi:hypothetical protein
VSDGYTIIAVYAGSAGANSGVGRFAVVRQNLIFGVQFPATVVDVGKTGAVEIVKARRDSKTKPAAQSWMLKFSSGRGISGWLNLARGRVERLR